MNKYVLLGFVIILMIFVSSCTSNPDNEIDSISDNIVELNIDSFNWGFNQDTVTINKGDTVRLKLTSSSGRHGIAIPKFNVATAPVLQGEEQVVEFIATESGTFNYFCNSPCGGGHHNMRGKLVVE